MVGPAAQFHGLRRAADVRPRARRKRTLSARPDDGARRAASRTRTFCRRHRHPHDRLPERLRAALPRGDRLGRQRAGPLQPLSRRRLRRLAAQQALRARTSITPASSPRSIPCSPLMRATGKRVSASVTSPSAPALSRRPATAATFTPMWAGKPNARGGDLRAKGRRFAAQFFTALCCFARQRLASGSIV